MNMDHVVWQILIGSSIYILLGFILFKFLNKSDNPNDDGDDDGGIISSTPPTLDLPPGVTLPKSPSPKEKEPELQDVYI